MKGATPEFGLILEGVGVAFTVFNFVEEFLTPSKVLDISICIWDGE